MLNDQFLRYLQNLPTIHSVLHTELYYILILRVTHHHLLWFWLSVNYIFSLHCVLKRHNLYIKAQSWEAEWDNLYPVRIPLSTRAEKLLQLLTSRTCFRWARGGGKGRQVQQLWQMLRLEGKLHECTPIYISHIDKQDQHHPYKKEKKGTVNVK